MSKKNQSSAVRTLSADQTQLVEQAATQAAQTVINQTAATNVETTSNKKEPRPLPEGISGLPSKSAKIRALASAPHNWPRADIGRALGIRYQMVRNILSKPLKAQTTQAPASQE